jgi:hypothetical protein
VAANPDGLTTIRDQLVNELAAETARRVALVTAGNPPPVSYTVGGKQVQWTEYVTQMSASIKLMNELVVASGGDGGLYETVIQGYSG